MALFYSVRQLEEMEMESSLPLWRQILLASAEESGISPEQSLEKMNAAWTSFAAAVKIPNPYPTAAQQKYIVKWTADWKFPQEMLVLAYEETLKNAGKASFPYMDKVLAAWKSKGVDTPEKAAERERQYREDALAKAAERQTAKPRPSAKKNDPLASNAPSYDMDKAEEKLFTTPPRLKKKKEKR